ncbi:MAG: Mu-like prophage major head subunit gpT family protein [Victivallaceae bacterium]|nr:Mu-like prophage major head subunit gpT family protein [Victivallaceae bacterium]
MIINQASLRALFQGFRVLYDDALDAAKARWPELAMESPSNNMQEVHAWLDAMPGMKELIGEVMPSQLSASDYAIKNKEWESTVRVKETAIRFDNYGVYNTAFSSLGEAAAYHPDELLAGLLCNGFLAKSLSYLGVPFFSANQKLDAAGKFKFTNSTDAPLSAAAYATARANIKSRVNKQGRSMNLGRKLKLVVGPDNEKTGLDILVAENLPGGGSNVNKGSAELMVWPAIAAYNPAAWFLVENGTVVKPFVVQFALKPTLQACNAADSEVVMLKHEYIYQAYGIYNAGYMFPELAYGSTGDGEESSES